jgi:hypothetical protein
VSKRSRPPQSKPGPAAPPPAASPAARSSSGSAGTGLSTAGGPRRGRVASATAPRSPLERYRGAILGVAVVAVLVAAGAFVFMGAAQPTYACEAILSPEAAATAAPDATPRLGQVTRDLGRAHVDTGERVRYEFCPPTSGAHWNDARFGPLPNRFYGADDKADPQGWIHNLEHGHLVVLYRCPEDGSCAAAETAMRAVQEQLPASPLCSLPAGASVVTARFDDLPSPYAAVAWGRVLFLDTPDVAEIAAFQQQSADRGPEPQCQNAVPGATSSPTPAP